MRLEACLCPRRRPPSVDTVGRSCSPRRTGSTPVLASRAPSAKTGRCKRVEVSDDDSLLRHPRPRSVAHPRGPSATMMLGDQGADVIKVERPDRRRHPELGAPFVGGRGLLPLLQPQQALDRRRPQAAAGGGPGARAGAGLRRLRRELHRDCRAPGPGPTTRSARSNRAWSTARSRRMARTARTATGPGYDMVALRVGGLMGSRRPAAPASRRAITDVLTGVYAAARSPPRCSGASGAGAPVCRLLAAHVAGLGPGQHRSNWLAAGREASRWGTAHESIVPTRCSRPRTADRDRRGQPEALAGLLQAMGHEEWRADARFASNPDRVQHREVLLPLSRPRCASGRATSGWRSSSARPSHAAGQRHAARVLRSAGAPPRHGRRVAHPTIGTLGLAGIPIKYSATPGAIRLPLPCWASTPRDPAAGAALRPAQAGALRAQGVIA